MVGMGAGTPCLDQLVAQGAQTCQVEFGRGIVAARFARLLRREQAIGADDATRIQLLHHQVFTPGIETILVDAVLGIREYRAHVFGEDAVAQALYFLDLFGRPSEADNQSRGDRTGPGFRRGAIGFDTN